jgi:hydroxypyruvate isomerase
MIKTDVLIDTFFKNEPIEKRVARVADCGFKFIETWAGGDAGLLHKIASECKKSGVELVSVVLASGNEEDLVPVRAENLQRFAELIDKRTDYALAAGCSQGIVTTGQSVTNRSYQQQRAALVEALRAAGSIATQKGFRLNLEPLNTEIDHPGYFLDSALDGAAIIKEVGMDNVRLLYDIYHMGIMGGNQTAFIEHNIQLIGHFHGAGIPGRHELFESEMDYPFLLKRICGAGYTGYFGLEYLPKLEGSESLLKTADYLANGPKPFGFSKTNQA